MSGGPQAFGGAQPPPPPRRNGVWIHILLFVLTFFSAALASALANGADPFSVPDSIRVGFPYAITLMSILLAHEMGHYTMARVHRVDATLPYFIPAPPIFFIGTFGAFIRMRDMPRDRRALFDIGAAGPWGGFLVAVPALVLGLKLSEVIPAPQSSMSGLFLGDSLLMRSMQQAILGIDPNVATVQLHPIALAAWVGFLVTALNLLPVGQLDGGHVVYALLGDVWHRWISRGTVVGLLILGIGGWPGWLFWVALLAMIGFRHPRTADPVRPLDRNRLILAVLTLVMLVLVFMPEPVFERAAPIVLPPGRQIEV